MRKIRRRDHGDTVLSKEVGDGGCLERTQFCRLCDWIKALSRAAGALLLAVVQHG